MSSKLFGLDSSTVRQITKLFALDGSTPRRVKKLFSLDGSTVRLIFEDFSTFTVSGTSNLIQSPVNEVVRFGVRNDFNAGGTDVNISNSGSGDTNNVGGISGLSIDVDSSHTYNTTTTVAADPSDSNGITVNYINATSMSAPVDRAYMGAGSGNSYQRGGRSSAVLAGNYTVNANYNTGYPKPNNTKTWGGSITSAYFTGTIGNQFFQAGPLGFKTTSEAGGTNYNVSYAGGNLSVRACNSRSNYNATWQVGIPGWGTGSVGINIQSPRGLMFTGNHPHYGAGRANGGNGQIYYPGYNTTTTVSTTGRRARVQNGSNRPFTVNGGGLNAGGNFATGTLNAGASTAFITANSTNESWTLQGVAQKNPATFSIANADGTISVSGTFADGETASAARDRIQSALNGNSTFQSKFNTGTDADETHGGVAHKVVIFTSDTAENTSDFSITITQNDGSNTTPFEETTTQGQPESLQTTVAVTRSVSGSSVTSTKAISSLANADTSGAEVATLATDITYDASTNKLKVQDQDATVAVTNPGTLSFSKD